MQTPRRPSNAPRGLSYISASPGLKLAAAVVLLALAAGCEPSRAQEQPSEAPIPEVQLGAPEVRTVAQEKAFVCDLRAAQRAEIRSRAAGVLRTIAIDDGQQVSAGDPLFTVEAKSREQAVVVAKSAALAAKSELEAAKLERNSTRDLHTKNIVSDTEFALAESKVRLLKARLDEATAAVKQAAIAQELTTVTAPISGLVSRVPRKLGSSIGEDELLTTIVDVSTVYAYFRLSEREYLAFLSQPNAARGTEVELELADGSVYAARGSIDGVEGEFDTATGTIAMRARFQNPDLALKHGGTGKVIVKTPHPGAIVVPQAATFDVQGNLFVYVVDESNVARARRIETAGRAGEWFIVSSGVEPSDRIVLQGVQRVRDGERVAPMPVAPGPTAANGGAGKNRRTGLGG